MLTWLYGQKEETDPDDQDDQMVHRPSDSRLLSNLISHEKEYSKQLQALLDSSHASLASLSAFAAATIAPISQVILSISGDFSSADDALRRYKDAVDAWREQLKALKDMETEVSTIIRDREILVSRLLKASKNEKPPRDKGNGAVRRNSIVSQGLHAPSSSSLSLSLDHSGYAPSTPLPTSNKLAAARNELQACEVHLAEKERELGGARKTAIRDGLRIRCNALIDCGRSWVEMGKDGLRKTETLCVEEGDMDGIKYSQGPHPAPALPHHMRTETGSDHQYRLSSDFSSISPSQSASQVSHLAGPFPSVIPNAPNPILGANGSDIQHEVSFPAMHTTAIAAPVARPTSTPPLIAPPIDAPSTYILPRSNSLTHVTSHGQPTTEHEHNRMEILPVHTVQDDPLPTVKANMSKPEATRTGSGYLTPVSDHNGPTSTLEYSTQYRVADAEEDFCGERSGKSPDFSKEHRLLREGKLQVVENPCFQRGPISDPSVSENVPRNERITMPQGTLLTDGLPRKELDVVNVREIQQETGPDLRTEPSQGVPSSIPTGEPQTPKKHVKRSGSPSPHKSKFFGSLKKVFGGGHHREPSETREVTVREKEEKERERKDKAKEKRDEKMRELEEKREERTRGKEEKARLKQKQKQVRERAQQRKLLVPDSSDDEDEVRVDYADSLKRQRLGKRPRGFIGLGKKGDKWTSRTDRNLVEISRESTDAEGGERKAHGYVIRRNTDLERNLRGGILSGGHTAAFDLRKGRTSIQSDTESPGRGGRVSSSGRFVVERGSKVTRSSSVPPSGTLASTRPGGGTSTLVTAATPGGVPSASRTIPPSSGITTRFREDLNSPKFEPAKETRRADGVNGVVKDKGYASDTSDLTTSAHISGMRTAPAFVSPTTGAISVPSVHRKPSKRAGMTQTHGEDGTARHAPTLSSVTAPASMSTGLGGRRGSVGVSVAAPYSATGTSFHRRAVSVDYGRCGPMVTAPIARGSTTNIPVLFTTEASMGNHESLKNIVDSVTRNNREAWQVGMMGSKMDRTKGKVQSGVASNLFRSTSGKGSARTDTTSFAVPRRGLGMESPAGRPRLDEPVADKKVISAPSKANHQTLISSFKGTPGSPGRAQPLKVDGIPEQKPLKSAFRFPLPDSRATAAEPIVSRGYSPGFATQTGKDRIIPMEVLPSVASLVGEDPFDMPPPVERIRSVGDNIAEYGQNGQDEDDSVSTSSYETGHENLDEDKQGWSSDDNYVVTPSQKSESRQKEDTDRRPDPGFPHLAMPQPVRTDVSPLRSAVSKFTPPPEGSHPSPTPQRRKSVRVSLNPTFSPTPPAIENEDDEDGRAPFVFKEADVPRRPRSWDTKDVELHAVPSTKQSYGNQKTAGKDVKNIWDDDSDEDADYLHAKSLLLKATRREQDVMGMSSKF